MYSAERTTYPKSFRLSAPLFAAALLLSACTDNAAPKPTPSFEHTTKVFEPEKSVCNELFDNDIMSHTNELKHAANCLAIYHTGKVAFIDYDMGLKKATAFSKELETRFDKATDGIAEIDVSVVEASPKAKADYYTINDGTCTDAGNTDSWGSAIADRDMPSLHHYDILMAETNLPTCDNSADGIADVGTNYTQLFEANKLDGAQIVKKLKSGVTETTTHGDLGFDAVHELLHQYGLGHAGTLYSPSKDGGYEDFDAFLNKSTHVAIDLNSYISKGQYDEYGDYDILPINDMSDSGNYSRKELIQKEGLNPMQLDRLRLPQYQLGTQKDTDQLDTNKGVVILDSNTTSQDFASFTFDKPILAPAPQSTKGDGTVAYNTGLQFERMAFVPEFTNYNGKKQFQGLDAYVTSDEYDMATVALGPMFCTENGQPKTYDIHIGAQTLRVIVDTDKATIEAL